VLFLHSIQAGAGGFEVSVSGIRLCVILKVCVCVQDYVILDEGHKIKNPANKCAKGVHMISARNRIILSGTPIMNNLKVLHIAKLFCLSIYHSAGLL